MHDLPRIKPRMPDADGKGCENWAGKVRVSRRLPPAVPTPAISWPLRTRQRPAAGARVVGSASVRCEGGDDVLFRVAPAARRDEGMDLRWHGIARFSIGHGDQLRRHAGRHARTVHLLLMRPQPGRLARGHPRGAALTSASLQLFGQDGVIVRWDPEPGTGATLVHAICLPRFDGGMAGPARDVVCRGQKRPSSVSTHLGRLRVTKASAKACNVYQNRVNGCARWGLQSDVRTGSVRQ
jgi:hypothetical protein